MTYSKTCFILIACLIGYGYCWDSEELEIFDLVEEVETNFYTVLGVRQDANSTDIKKAYRKLSLLLHPDKNDATDAEIKFRQLVAVYEVLRDPRKRSLYDQVLENGLPDWRQAVYYYRRVRKMGIAEMAIILFVILTIGQYCVSWAAYLEKKYTAKVVLEAKLKRLQKKQKKGRYDGQPLPESIILDIPSPSVLDTLPFQLPRFVWYAILLCPRTVQMIREYWAERKRYKEEEAAGAEEEEEVVITEPRAPRRRKGKFAPPELPNSEDGASTSSNVGTSSKEEVKQESAPQVSGGIWTDDDLSELCRLVKKFPPGTPSRWEKIAQAMQRSVPEVTHMAKKVKESGYRHGSVSEICEQATADLVEEKPGKTKTKGVKLSEEVAGSPWSQLQQQALEASLIKFPKSGSYDRWEKIAKCVPGKTKDECMMRFKQCFELVKKKKVTGDSTSEQTT